MTRVLRVLLVTVAVAGCTLQPGSAFGKLRQADFTATFTPPAARYDAEGRLKTDTDYRITVDSLTLAVGRLSFEETTGTTGGSNVTFDPSKPPPGYLICHNGHCDREDGALIPYEDVQAELSGGTRTTRTVLSLTSDRPLSLKAGTASIALAKPAAGDALARGEWSRAVLALSTLQATGTVSDPTTAQRLGGQVREWALTLTPATFSHKVTVSIGRRQGETVDVAAQFALTEKLWDQIDWRALAASSGRIDLDASASVRTQLLENAAQSRFTLTTNQ